MKSRRIWRTGLIALGILAGAWAFAALLLPVLWPFLIGLAVSLLAEKPVRLLQTRARFPRWLASGVCVLTLFVLLFGGAFFLCRLLCTEAADLARQLPQLAEGLAPPVLRLKERLLSLAEKLPDGLGKGLRAGVESFFQNGAGFGSKLYESLFSWASGVIGRLPDAVLFTVTAVLSSFISSVTPNSEATSDAVSKSSSWLIVAMMPSSISFLMISPAGLPMRSVRSRTVMVSAVI